MYLRDLQDEDFEIAIKVEDLSLNPNGSANLFALDPFLLDKRCGRVRESHLCALNKGPSYNHSGKLTECQDSVQLKKV